MNATDFESWKKRMTQLLHALNLVTAPGRARALHDAAPDPIRCALEWMVENDAGGWKACAALGQANSIGRSRLGPAEALVDCADYARKQLRERELLHFALREMALEGLSNDLRDYPADVS